MDRFAPSADINDKNVRQRILLRITQLPTRSYMDFQDANRIKEVPWP